MKIVDVTSKIERGYQTVHADQEGENINIAVVTPQAGKNKSPGARTLPEPRIPNSDLHRNYDPQWQSESPSFDTPHSMTVSYPDDRSFQTEEDQHIHMERSVQSGYLPDLAGSQSNEQGTTFAAEQRTGSSYSHINTEDVAADLLALRYLPLQNTQPQQQTSPGSLMLQRNDLNTLAYVDQDQILFNDPHDGIFLPGSAYREFHSTLRDHLIYTARSNAPTRNATPELLHPGFISFDRVASRACRDVAMNRTDLDPESARPSKPPEITLQREYILWKNWIDEMAPWVSQPQYFPHLKLKYLA